MKKGFARPLVFAFLTLSLSHSGNYYTNESAVSSEESGVGFYVIDEENGSRETLIDKDKTDITPDAIDFVTGKLRYQIAPTLKAVPEEESYCAFKYAYIENDVSGDPKITYGDEVVGTSQSNEYVLNPSAYLIVPPPATLKVLHDCSIQAEGLSGPGSVETSSVGTQRVYTFDYPSSSGGWDSGICRGDDFNCIADSYELDHDGFFNEKVLKITVPSVAESTGTGILAFNTPEGDVYFSPRLRMQKALQCRKSLFDGSGQIPWKVFKFNGSDGWGMLNSGLFSQYDDTYYNQVYTTGSQHYVLHNTFMDTIDQGLFEELEPLYTYDYLKADQLSTTACEKVVCPRYFTPYTEEEINQDSSLANLCHRKIPRIKLKPIPKRIFVQYPEDGAQKTYTVPNLDEYFSPGNPANTIEYEVVGQDQTLDVKLDVQDRSKLLINIKATPSIETGLRNNYKYQAYFVLRAKEKMIAQNANNYYFPKRELAVDIRIDVDILSSIYQPSEMELYRCQALTQ